jgi:hypothetical protein
MWRHFICACGAQILGKAALSVGKMTPFKLCPAEE